MRSLTADTEAAKRQTPHESGRGALLSEAGRPDGTGDALVECANERESEVSASTFSSLWSVVGRMRRLLI